jgi:hypothetical protein
MAITGQGVTGLLTKLGALSRLSEPAQLDKGVRKAALLLQGRIQGRASGRPGPRVITGNYRRSWNTVKLNVAGGKVAYSVGTNAPQGRRLEFGFNGTDALGRAFKQAPYPHVEPALAESVDEMFEMISGGIDSELFRP